MILPGGVTYAEVCGASAVSKVCVVEVGGASSQSDAWLLLWEDGISVHPVVRHTRPVLRVELSALTRPGNQRPTRCRLVLLCPAGGVPLGEQLKQLVNLDSLFFQKLIHLETSSPLILKTGLQQNKNKNNINTSVYG